MKKTAIGMAVVLLMIGLGLVMVVVVGGGTLKGQTSTPASSTPSKTTPSTPSTTTPSAPVASTAVVNRALSRWMTTNQTLLASLITDSQKLQDYISNMQMDYAETAGEQVRCDINTMRGVPPPNTTTDTYYFPPGEKVVNPPEEYKGMVTNSPIPRPWLWLERLSYQHYTSRENQGAPSGVECPPIPDAQAYAQLNAGLNQLETALNHMFNGINDSREGLLLGLEAELQAANATLQQVTANTGGAGTQ